jgi:hypothetical protein
MPWLEESSLGPLNPCHKQLVCVLGLLQIEAFLPGWQGSPGRPQSERAALARAFVAKAVFNFPTTRLLIVALSSDKTLRQLCGWQRRGELPSEATFSRAFAEFSAGTLPSRLHAALIEQTHAKRLVGHISRDSTAIEAREKPVKSQQPVPTPQVARKRGRPRKDEIHPPPEPSRIERQLGMTLPAMLAELPRNCSVGVKRNAQGYQESWIGYKLHIDTADGEIPISCILTAASVHDSQVAIPLATMSARRVTNLYDLMDSAYDAPAIRQHSRNLEHVPIIDINPRANKKLKQEIALEARRLRHLGHQPPQQVRYRQRSSAERVNGALKDNHGARTVRVRGPDKVMCHLMFGVLTLTALQLMRLLP